MFVNNLSCVLHCWLGGVDDESDQRLAVDVERLLPDLQKYVDEDNERFEAELMAWDCEQRKKTSRGNGCAADVTAGSVSTTGNDQLLLTASLPALHLLGQT